MPDVICIPIALFLVLCGLGLWGVMAGRNLYILQAKQSASYEASATLSSIIQLLQLSYTPMLALREKVVTNPFFPALESDWRNVTGRLLSGVNEDDQLISLQVAPFGKIAAVDPLSLLGPSLGLNLLTGYASQLEQEIHWGELGWEGPFFIHQGNWTMMASLPIFVPSNFSSHQKPDPAWGGPPTNATCNITQCNGTMGKWWGTIYAPVLLDSLLQEPNLISLRSHGWIAELKRLLPHGSPDTNPLLFSLGGGSLTDPVSVALNLGKGHSPEQPELLLQLSLSPSSGSWTGTWWIGALIGVVILGLCSSILLFLHLLSSVQLSWLLHSMIPPLVVSRLQKGETFAALHDSCILFCDVVGFTSLTREMDPRDVARLVDEMTVIWEEEAAKEGLLRIDLVGDSFMAGAGCLEHVDPYESAVRTARVALAIIKSTKGLMTPDGTPVQVRVGIHSGPCVTAVVGSRCPKLSVFSDVVNVASRMESTSVPGLIQISHVVASRLVSRGLDENGLEVTKRGMVKLKNRGEMETFWLFEAGPLKRNSCALQLPSSPQCSVDIQLDQSEPSLALNQAISMHAERLSPSTSILSANPRPSRDSGFWAAKEPRPTFLRRNCDSTNENQTPFAKLDDFSSAAAGGH